jgi:parallel beta-helix repeat protein
MFRTVSISLEGSITTKLKIGLSFGIIFLLVVMSFTSISGNQINENIIIPSYKGNILYVGGSGPGNYSKIQDAIDNASDGDTVFVYSGIYYENVRIMQKTIELIGEDTNLTIIDANYSEYPLLIVSSNYVRVNGFTLINPVEPPHNDWSSVVIKIKNCHDSIIENNIVKQYHIEFGGWNAGIYLINSESNIIRNNIICNTDRPLRSVGIMLDSDINLNNNISNNEIYGFVYGILIDLDDNPGTTDNTIYGNYINHNCRGITVQGGRNENIINNIITHNRYDGLTVRSDNCLISGNIISNNGAGGEFDYGLDIHSDNNYIINNEISNNDPIGIMMWDYTNNYLINNNITKNKQIGLYVFFSLKNYVSYNNFIDNGNYNAFFENYIENSFSVKWNKNYWSDYSGESYHIIPGYIYLIFRGVPWKNYDRNPSKEPYDINETKNYDIDDYSSYLDNRLVERFPLISRLLNIGWWNLE